VLSLLIQAEQIEGIRVMVKDEEQVSENEIPVGDADRILFTVQLTVSNRDAFS